MLARNPSNCCSDCERRVCCCCVCNWLCVTLEVDDGDNCCCTGKHYSLEWNRTEDAWIGEFNCGDLEAIDVRYFFTTEDDGVWLNLRSDALGYPEGDEYRWRVGQDVDCEDMETSIQVALPYGSNCDSATLSTNCLHKFKPSCCATCKCLPQCLLGQLTICGFGFPGHSQGMLCWNDDDQQYEGHVTENNGTSHAMTVKIRPRCLFDDSMDEDEYHSRPLVYKCDTPNVTRTDPCELPVPDCNDPQCATDAECVAVVSIPDLLMGEAPNQAPFEKWYPLPEGCRYFGELAGGSGQLTDGRPVTYWFIRDDPDPNNQFPCTEDPYAGTQFLCDCPTHSMADAPYDTISLRIENCPRLHDCVCRETYANLIRNATVPGTVTVPNTHCPYYWGVAGTSGRGPIGMLLYCSENGWAGDYYCSDDSGVTFTYVSSPTISVDCLPGARPHLHTSLPDCCRCDSCDPCEHWPDELMVEIASSNYGQSGSAVMSCPDGAGCVAFMTSLGDQMSVRLDLDLCQMRVGCNAIACEDFNCVLGGADFSINSCNPVDITATFGFCAACGATFGHYFVIHIYE